MPWSIVAAEMYSLFGRSPKSNRLVVELAEPAPVSSTLDVGCGPGAAVRTAAPLVQQAVGVDDSAAMVRIATRRSRSAPNVEFRVAAAEALPFAAATFDRIWTVHAFHHWSDRAAGIAEARRVLRPGGRFLIVERRSRDSHGLSTAEADEVSERLIRAGFANSHVGEHGKQLVITGHA